MSAIGKYIDVNGERFRLVDPSREVVLNPDDTLEFGAALNGSWLSHETGYVSEERLSEALRSLLPKPKKGVPAQPSDAKYGVDANENLWMRERYEDVDIWVDPVTGTSREWMDLAHPVTILRPEQPTGGEG